MARWWDVQDAVGAAEKGEGPAKSEPASNPSCIKYIGEAEFWRRPNDQASHKVDVLSQPAAHGAATETETEAPIRTRAHSLLCAAARCAAAHHRSRPAPTPAHPRAAVQDATRPVAPAAVALALRDGAVPIPGAAALHAAPHLCAGDGGDDHQRGNQAGGRPRQHTHALSVWRIGLGWSLGRKQPAAALQLAVRSTALSWQHPEPYPHNAACTTACTALLLAGRGQSDVAAGPAQQLRGAVPLLVLCSVAAARLPRQPHVSRGRAAACALYAWHGMGPHARLHVQPSACMHAHPPTHAHSAYIPPTPYAGTTAGGKRAVRGAASAAALSTWCARWRRGATTLSLLGAMTSSTAPIASQLQYSCMAAAVHATAAAVSHTHGSCHARTACQGR